jgi:surfeit locus 1 family protein
MTFSRLLPLAAILVGAGFLITLGSWQMARLQWKENLIAEIAQRTAGPPAPLAEIELRWWETGDVDYYPVTVTGYFQHAFEQYYYNTHMGAVGWNVYTPFVLDDGRKIIVNRGFVPDRLREPEERPASLVEGRQVIAGLARDPLYEKPNFFVPDNRLADGIYFWRSIRQMAVAADIGPDALVPFFIDAGAQETSGGYPVGGTTRITFPNNHLQYAFTWYGLAVALLATGIYFLYSTRPRHTP